jgi:hypothetical protein
MKLSTKNGSGLSVYWDRDDLSYLCLNVSALFTKDGYASLNFRLLGLSIDLNAYWGVWSS